MADLDAIKETKEFYLDIPQKSEAFFLKGSNALGWGMQNRLSSIFNPKTGLSANIRPAISVLADNATTADAIATAAICMSDNQIRNIASNLNLEILSLNPEGIKKIS